MANNFDYVDPIFEADAPKYFDFNKIDDENEMDEADLWFETHFDENDNADEMIDNENAAHLKSLGVDLSSENRENVPPPSDSYQRTPQKANKLLQSPTPTQYQIETVEVSEYVQTLSQYKTIKNNVNRGSIKVLERSASSTVVESSIKSTLSHETQATVLNSKQSQTGKVPVAVNNKPVSDKKLIQRQNRSASVDRAASKEKLTVPVTPTLLTSKRAGSRDNLHRIDSQNDNYAFKARPVPRTLLASPTVGLKKPKPKTPTKAIEPNFQIEKRLAIRRSFRVSKETDLDKEKTEAKIIRKKSTEDPKITSVEPFSFQSKEDELIEKRKKLIEEFNKREAEKPRVQPFKAAPMPSQSPDKLPEKHAKSPTVSNPFNFLTDNIHLAYEKKLRERLEREEKARKQAAEFRAHTAEVLTKEPFKLKHEEHHSLEMDEFSLETMKRAGDRKRFDDFLKVKDAEREAALNERRMIEEKVAAEEIKQIRSNAVHKAQPIKKYKDVKVKPKFECTVPIPHRFAVDDRLKNRRNK